jgi:hypothetical protein
MDLFSASAQHEKRIFEAAFDVQVAIFFPNMLFAFSFIEAFLQAADERRRRSPVFQ